jgi:hypothetical protein
LHDEAQDGDDVAEAPGLLRLLLARLVDDGRARGCAGIFRCVFLRRQDWAPFGSLGSCPHVTGSQRDGQFSRHPGRPSGSTRGERRDLRFGRKGGADLSGSLRRPSGSRGTPGMTKERSGDGAAIGLYAFGNLAGRVTSSISRPASALSA